MVIASSPGDPAHGRLVHKRHDNLAIMNKRQVEPQFYGIVLIQYGDRSQDGLSNMKQESSGELGRQFMNRVYLEPTTGIA
jgi:hypothetical protein